MRGWWSGSEEGLLDRECRKSQGCSGDFGTFTTSPNLTDFLRYLCLPTTPWSITGYERPGSLRVLGSYLGPEGFDRIRGD